MSNKNADCVGSNIVALQPSVHILTDNEQSWMCRRAKSYGGKYRVSCTYFGHRFFAEKEYADMAAKCLFQGYIETFMGICKRHAIDIYKPFIYPNDGE